LADAEAQAKLVTFPYGGGHWLTEVSQAGGVMGVPPIVPTGFGSLTFRQLFFLWQRSLKRQPLTGTTPFEGGAATALT